MRLLLLGATGLLGHHLWQRISDTRPEIELFGTAAHRWPDPFGLFIVRSSAEAVQLIRELEPDVVLNCAGVVKQRDVNPVELIEANALLPQQAAAESTRQGGYFVQISSDCIFSGELGGYREEDPPSPVDPYGMTKALGEVVGPFAVTLRTSFIGRELPGRPHFGLLERFLASTDPMPGWAEAIWSGLTAEELAQVILDIVLPRRLTGLYHVAGPAISKLHLLEILAKTWNHPRPIVPTKEPRLDRSLCADRFEEATGYRPPAWPEMLWEECRYADSRLLSASPSD